MINFQVFSYLVNKIQDQSVLQLVQISVIASVVSIQRADYLIMYIECQLYNNLFLFNDKKCLSQIGFLQYENYLQTAFTRKIQSVIF